jgi:hypothetical protein
MGCPGRLRVVRVPLSLSISKRDDRTIKTASGCERLQSTLWSVQLKRVQLFLAYFLWGDAMARSDDREIDRTITNNLTKLSKYGVLTARPGYEITDHQLTGRRAIVATVHIKKPKAGLDQGEVLPDNIGGVPVDVREANSYQRLRAIDPLAAKITQTYRRPEEAEPEWPLEREIPSGELLTSARSETQKTLAAQTKAQPGGARTLTAHEHKPQLEYDPVGCLPLDAIDVTARVTTAASPDAGLATLTKFLRGTNSSLIVGMYDFTSATILGDFKSDLTGSKALQMVLDDPAPNDTRDQTDWETVQDLKQPTEAELTRFGRLLALTLSRHNGLFHMLITSRSSSEITRPYGYRAAI